LLRKRIQGCLPTRSFILDRRNIGAPATVTAASYTNRQRNAGIQ